MPRNRTRVLSLADDRARAYLASLNPRLPRAVQILQLGGLANAFGNGIVFPFLFIYLHNVRGIGLGTVGLVLATNGAVSLVAGPLSGPVDRPDRRPLDARRLARRSSPSAYGGYAFVTSVAGRSRRAVVAGIGNGAFWPRQSTLIAGLTPRDERPAAFAMQRVMMNLGIGLGGARRRADRVDRLGRASFRALFLIDAATFVAYLLVVLARVPEPRRGASAAAPQGSYRDVLRHRVFVAVIALNCAVHHRRLRAARAAARLHEERRGRDRARRRARLLRRTRS